MCLPKKLFLLSSLLLNQNTLFWKLSSLFNILLSFSHIFYFLEAFVLGTWLYPLLCAKLPPMFFIIYLFIYLFRWKCFLGKESLIGVAIYKRDHVVCYNLLCRSYILEVFFPLLILSQIWMKTSIDLDKNKQ